MTMATRISSAGTEAGGTIADSVAGLLPDFASRAAECDDSDRFVAENYKALKEAGLIEAAARSRQTSGRLAGYDGPSFAGSDPDDTGDFDGLARRIPHPRPSAGRLPERGA